MKKAGVYAAMLLMMAALTCCGKEEETEEEEVVSVTEEQEPGEEEPEATPTEAPKPKNTAEQEALYKALSEWGFEFSSGAGGWGTELYFKPDGSYTGMYHDSEMGDTGRNYPNGTVYVCNFYGQLKGYKKISDYEYELNIGQVTYEKEDGDEEIDDGVRYVYTVPYGMADTRVLRCYLPGAPLSELPEGFMSWMHMQFSGYYGDSWVYGEDYPEELSFCGLYNEAQDAGFYSWCNCEENRLYIKNRAKLPGLKNKKLDLYDDGTYYCEDADDGYMVRITNFCFKEEQGLSTYLEDDKEALLKECLEKTDGDHDISSVYFKSGEYNDNEDIYNRINGKEGFMAVWSEGGNEDYRWCMAKVYQNTNYTDGMGTVYTYAYVIEMDPDSEFYSAEQMEMYTSGLTHAGTSDGLSSASADEPAKVITGYVKGDGNVGLQIDEVLWIGWGDEDLIAQYGLTDDDMTNDYYIAEAGDGYDRYKVSDDCSIFMQFPEENSQRLWYTPIEYAKREAKNGEALMRIMLDAQDRVIFAYEPYRP